MTALHGDPASMSACASTLAVLGRDLQRGARPLATEVAALADRWGTRASVAPRRRAAGVAQTASELATELTATAAVLNDYAAALTSSRAAMRSLTQRCADAGLEVRDGAVTPALGVLVAAERAHERSRQAEYLQRELDLIGERLDAAGAEAMRHLADSRTSLTAMSDTLRHG